MMKYVTPLLLATLFVRSPAQEFDGPSEYTIGQGWDATGVEGVFQDECVIQDKAACEEQATRLGYKFLEAGSKVVKGCFLRFPFNDNVKVPLVRWRETAEVDDIEGSYYNTSLPMPGKSASDNTARIYLCTTIIDKWKLQAVGEDSIEGKPSSTVDLGDGVEPFTVRTFFETNENLFSTADFDNTYTVEVYTGVGAEQDDCSTGTQLVNEGAFIITKTVSNVEFPYNQEFKDTGGKLFPQFTEGKVGEAIVTLSDPLYVSIYTADDGNDDIDGTIEF